MTRIVFFLLITTLIMNSSQRSDCVDCNLKVEKQENVGVEYVPTILYECAKPVKVYIRKYTCRDCGYFEVSVRNSSSITTKGSCIP